MQVTVLFFGVLAEVTGTAFKHYNEARTVGELQIMLRDDYPELAHYSFRISVNSKMTDEDLALKTGDEIALLPPFAGG